jgi:hypothetical protein
MEVIEEMKSEEKIVRCKNCGMEIEKCDCGYVGPHWVHRTEGNRELFCSGSHTVAEPEEAMK